MIQDILALCVLRSVSRVLDGRAAARLHEIRRDVAGVAQDLAVHLGLLPYYVEHTVLQRLLVLRQEILLPGVVADIGIQIVPLQAFPEKAEAVLVIGLLLELQAAAIHHEVVELLGHTVAEILQPRLELFVLDILILFVLVTAWEPLPRQTALHEVEEHVANRFQIIPSTLLLALVRIERCVPRRTREVLAVPVPDVLPIRRLVVLGQPKVNDVQVVLRAVLATNQKVIWFDITVYDSFLVALLNPLYHLYGHHAACLEVKLMAARLEQVLKALP